MNVLQRIVLQILHRLRGISTSQRVALLLGGTLVAVSLLWLVQWAAGPEMTPLLDQDFQPDEIAQVRSGLEQIGEPCQVRGNKVYVRASAHRQSLIAQLQLQEKLPANTSTAFANLIKQSDPWISMEESSRRWTFALQQTLEQVLRQFNGVKSANVFLNLGGQQKTFTRTPPPSSASVTLAMKQGAEVPRALALAAARLVAGAVAGLPAHNVEVVDATTGRVALDWDAEQDVTNQLQRKLAQEELRFAQKIRQQVPDPKALVSVQVTLNPTTSNIQTEQPLKGVAKSERTTRQETSHGRTSEMPGVQPNVGMVAGSTSGAETNSQETTETESEVGLARKVEATPPGEVQKVTAAISLSFSYLEGVFRRSNPAAEPGAAGPTDAQIEEVFQRERTRLLSQVVQLVRPQLEENVAISRYYDSAAELAVGGAEAGRVGEALDLVKSYGPQAGLALLALLSLTLMLRMARKSDASDMFGLELGLPKEAIEAAKTAAEDVSAWANRTNGFAATGRRPGAPAGPGPAGTASGGRGLDAELTAPVENVTATEGMLVAQEVDPGTVQTRKMLEQVTQMVESDPDVVAALVEQWVQRNEQYRDEGI
jgi:flagellar biosynthesis/type III secretory pathway M-ring protein FliF/YscJ